MASTWSLIESLVWTESQTSCKLTARRIGLILEEVDLANIKSQIKRNRQNEKKRLRNRIVRGTTRSVVKNAHKAIETGEVETSQGAVLSAISALDEAAQKGVLHKNNVARRKSRLMKRLAALTTK